MFILLNKKNGISKIISILVLANKKVFLKNQIFSNLSYIEITAKVILMVFIGKPSIFYMLILVGLVLSRSFAVKIRVIILTLLLEFNKALTLFV